MIGSHLTAVDFTSTAQCHIGCTLFDFEESTFKSRSTPLLIDSNQHQSWEDRTNDQSMTHPYRNQSVRSWSECTDLYFY